MRHEDLHHFDVGGSVDDGDASVSLTCLRCKDWVEWIEVGIFENSPAFTLADLIERGEKHLDDRHGGGA